MKTYSYDDWIAEAKRRFGDDVKRWRVVCPSCKTEQSVQDFLDVGVPAPAFGGSVGYSCIGRFVEGKGCDWTLGGLFKIHEVEVERDGERTPVFDFAPEDDNQGEAS